VSLSGEERLIRDYLAPLAGPAGLGLLDDAALVRVPEGRDLVVTKDALVAGVHFFADDPPEFIARKALRVNLSDLAAKGAMPLGCFLALALPPAFSEGDFARLAQGLAEDTRAFGLPLLGGDLVRTPGPMMLSVTALGTVPVGRMIRRTGVEAGDRLYVTGTIGDAALGLRLRMDSSLYADVEAADRDYLLDRYLLPQPRSILAPLVQAHAHAGMDVSDGFAGDLSKMLRVSGVSTVVDVDRVPFSAAAQRLVTRHPSLLATILAGGDDYELLLAVPPDQAAALCDGAATMSVALTFIGEAIAGKAPARFRSKGEDMAFESPSFSHFA
jgi:thiamine-monophosphate kinase